MVKFEETEFSEVEGSYVLSIVDHSSLRTVSAMNIIGNTRYVRFPLNQKFWNFRNGGKWCKLKIHCKVSAKSENC